ncbi:hypothetical protein V1520DRAFT_349030, partial [Lipomyces starkeyi]
GGLKLIEGILDTLKHLEKKYFVIAYLLRESRQESAVDDFLVDYLSNTQMDLMKSLLKLAVHASQKYYLSDRVTIPLGRKSETSSATVYGIISTRNHWEYRIILGSEYKEI